MGNIMKCSRVMYQPLYGVRMDQSHYTQQQWNLLTMSGNIEFAIQRNS